jgi:Uma2 family endonuclease
MLVAERHIAYKRSPRQIESKKKIPKNLIYELLDGEPIYYKGYQDVLNGNKTIEEIMGASGMQAAIIQYLMTLLIKNLDESKYWFFTGESGVHIDHRNNIAHDVAVYDINVLLPSAINTNYLRVPAEIAIEIDVKADLSKPKDYNYIQRKTDKILQFGTKKVIWIFTDTHKIMIAEPSKSDSWQIYDWDKDLELYQGVQFNIKKFLVHKRILIQE